MSEKEFYERLRPPEPTSPSELCSCRPETPVKLMNALGYNPIYCIICNLEVPPERLNLSEDIVQSIVHWRDLYNAIDYLWLDSSVYESWAKQQLRDMNSRINVLGREIQRELATIHRCYYWYFQDESDDEYSPLTTCPVCNEPLQEYPGGIFKQRVCENCGVIGIGE